MRRGATPPSERSGGLRDEVIREVSEKGERPNELGATPPSEWSGGLRDEVLRVVSEKGERPLRHGVRIGVDVGSVRIGIARSDPEGLLATPVETVRRGSGDVRRIAELAAEFEAMEVIVGLPAHLSGAE